MLTVKIPILSNLHQKLPHLAAKNYNNRSCNVHSYITTKATEMSISNEDFTFNFSQERGVMMLV